MNRTECFGVFSPLHHLSLTGLSLQDLIPDVLTQAQMQQDKLAAKQAQEENKRDTSRLVEESSNRKRVRQLQTSVRAWPIFTRQIVDSRWV